MCMNGRATTNHDCGGSYSSGAAFQSKKAVMTALNKSHVATRTHITRKTCIGIAPPWIDWTGGPVRVAATRRANMLASGPMSSYAGQFLAEYRQVTTNSTADIASNQMVKGTEKGIGKKNRTGPWSQATYGMPNRATRCSISAPTTPISPPTTPWVVGR